MSSSTQHVDSNGIMSRLNHSWQDVLDRAPAASTSENLRIDYDDNTVAYGLVTHTALESHVVRWILPLRLRPDSDYDVAFVGEHCLRICELSDHHCDLIELIRETDFRPRIVNASLLDVHLSAETHVAFTSPRIVLVLESGTVVFVTVSITHGKATISITYHETTTPWLIEQPGIHIAVDPQSRYLAMACNEGRFALCKLEREEGVNSPITALRHFTLPGIILKMAFMHPSEPAEPNAIILLLIVAYGGQTKLYLYNWGSNFDSECSVKFGSAFALVYFNKIVICRGLLADNRLPPNELEWEIVEMVDRSATSLHSGLSHPLWTAYTKPARSKDFGDCHDDLYLAREDGLVVFIEIEADSRNDFEIREMLAGVLQCRVGTAFTRLGYPDTSANDVLAVGGEGSNGAIYEMIPRREPKYVCVIPNYAHLFDLVAIPDPLSPHHRYQGEHDAPDILLATIGKSPQNCVRKLRYGYEVKPIYEISCEEHPMNGIWAYNEYGEEFPRVLALVGNSTLLMNTDISIESVIANPVAVDCVPRWIDTAHATLLFASSKVMSVQAIGSRYRVKCTSSSLPDVSLDRVCHGELDATICAIALYQNLVFGACDDGQGEAYLFVIQVKDTGLHELCRIPWRSSSTQPNFIVVDRAPKRNTLQCFIVAEHRVCALEDSYTHKLYAFELDVVSKQTWGIYEMLIKSNKVHAPTALYIYRTCHSQTFGLVGFEDGSLCCFHISNCLRDLPKGSLRFSTMLGRTSVKFGVQADEPEKLLMRCDNKLYGVKYDEELPFYWSIHPVWMAGKGANDNTDFALFPDGVVIYRGSKLYVCSLLWQTKCLPWIIESERNATSAHLMASATVRATQKPRPIGNTIVSCASGSHIQFMNFKAHDFIKCSKLISCRLPGSSPGNDILSMTFWLHKSEMTDTVLYGTRDGRFGAYNQQDGCYATLKLGASIKTIASYLKFIIAGAGSKVHLIRARRKITKSTKSTKSSPHEFISAAQYNLPSTVQHVEIWSQDSSCGEFLWVDVTTSKHSLFRFQLMNLEGRPAVFRPFFIDELRRDCITSIHSEELDITFVSDKTSCVTGIIYTGASFEVPHDEREQSGGTRRGRVCDSCLGDPKISAISFAAELASPIKKFISAYAAPPWATVFQNGEIEKKLNSLRIFHEMPILPQILGISLNGSVTCFISLRDHTCCLLSHLQYMIQTSKMLSRNTWMLPIKLKPQNGPYSRHVDGDILKRAAAPGKLALLMETHEDLEGKTKLIDLMDNESMNQVSLELFLVRILAPVM